MKIVVCVKQVPDTTTRVQVASDGCSVEESGITWILNPYDEFAVEEALRRKEACGGEVIVVCLGPDRASAAIRTCLAMGADRGIHISDPAAQKTDPLGTAKILAAVIAPLQPDVVLMGKYSIGEDNAQTPSILAEKLNLPQVSGAVAIEWKDGQVVAKRDIEGGVEVIACSLPAVISTHKGINEPRYPSLKGIMAAKKKEIQEVKLSGLGLTEEQVGAKARKLVWTKVSLPPARGGGQILSGEPEVVVPQLVRLLREEAKVL